MDLPCPKVVPSAFHGTANKEKMIPRLAFIAKHAYSGMAYIDGDVDVL
jgi:hypothetical protein